jgi:hypothetical protein
MAQHPKADHLLSATVLQMDLHLCHRALTVALSHQE